MTLLAALEFFFSKYGKEKTYWIAYSGGVDSHVLLSLCHTLKTNIPLNLRVIHINHGLHPQAKNWVQHCASICTAYGFEFITRNVEIAPAPGDSLEELAREKRYAEIAACMNVGDVLLTAHHQDDQAETLLLQLLRGAGPKGLAAMPSAKKFAQGMHLRPLLNFSRNDLVSYAHVQKLQWIDDVSNDNMQLTRNFIRHDILALLKTRWPNVSATIARSASHCAETIDLLETAFHELEMKSAGSKPNTLSVRKLLALSQDQQKLVLRAWIRRLGCPPPNSKKLATLHHDLLQAAQDRMPCVSWSRCEVRRYRDDLFLMPILSSHDATQIFTWDLQQPLLLPGIGILQARFAADQPALLPDIQSVSVRFRCGGEHACLAGRRTHTLKNLFQEWNVPVWMRDRIPLIFIEEKLMGVVGYFLDPTFSLKTGVRTVELEDIESSHQS